jgi:uncharacterized protein YqgC (DUF456 family)
MLGPSPYSLAPLGFRLRAVAMAAGRAAPGGPREAVLGALIGGHLASGVLPPAPIGAADRRVSAEAARAWLGTLVLPPVTRVAVGKLIAATQGTDIEALAAALAKVTEVTAPYLDRASRSELEQLALAVRGAGRAQA